MFSPASVSSSGHGATMCHRYALLPTDEPLSAVHHAICDHDYTKKKGPLLRYIRAARSKINAQILMKIHAPLTSHRGPDP
jgi:hypothetical protein